MDNKKFVEELEEYNEQIKEIFKESVSKEDYEAWADSFEIREIGEKEITVVYRGSRDVKEFKKEYRDVLWSCVCSVLGEGKKMKIVNYQKYSFLSPKMKRNLKVTKLFVIGMAFVCVATAIIFIMGNYIGNRNFRETFYSVSSLKADSSVRVIQISDLHGSSYGKNNVKLLTRVRELEPDVIILTGDIVDSAEKDTEYAVNLGKNLSEIAPSYYVYGNNETESIYDFELNEASLDEKFGFDSNTRDEKALLNVKDSFEESLEKTGIKVLKNEKDTIKVRTMGIDVYGSLTSNPSAFWSYSGQSFSDYIYENPDNIKITAVHEPFIFEEFQHDYWGDLMVCGHTHGGVIRIPIIGPLYTHEGGLLPERDGGFVYGRYDAAGKPLIVSSGLENSNILRMNNQPELVIIDINKF